MAQCLRISLAPSCKTCVLMQAYRRDRLAVNFIKRTKFKKERKSSPLNTLARTELLTQTCHKSPMTIKRDSQNMFSELVT